MPEELVTFIASAAPVLVLIAAFVVVSRRQQASYQAYLGKHMEATQQMTAVLERIAAALEKRASDDKR